MIVVKNRIGFILLAVWLIITGLAILLGVGSTVLTAALAILAVVAGILIIVGA